MGFDLTARLAPRVERVAMGGMSGCFCLLAGGDGLSLMDCGGDTFRFLSDVRVERRIVDGESSSAPVAALATLEVSSAASSLLTPLLSMMPFMKARRPRLDFDCKEGAASRKTGRVLESKSISGTVS